jgi:23S rRNA (cytidine1920-2'-O)/16S rRNA (cytidine1409-2'-O)-methyltransferase
MARRGLFEAAPLRGEVKLETALALFDVHVFGRVALDAGAAVGGFTRALRAAGAARVYAVDAGFGQLLGSLRQDRRVVNLERTNLGRLSRRLVPEPVELVTLDLSYLSLAAAVPQLAAVELVPACELVGLVKPQFELGLAALPDDAASFDLSVSLAARGVRAAGWHVIDSARSPLLGARGAVEFFIHARKDNR